jgi:hypothetical protein
VSVVGVLWRSKALREHGTPPDSPAPPLLRNAVKPSFFRYLRGLHACARGVRGALPCVPGSPGVRPAGSSIQWCPEVERKAKMRDVPWLLACNALTAMACKWLA